MGDGAAGDTAAYNHGVCGLWHVLEAEVVGDSCIRGILPVAGGWISSWKRHWYSNALVHIWGDYWGSMLPQKSEKIEEIEFAVQLSNLCDLHL